MFIISEINFPMSIKDVFDFGKFKRQIEILGLCLPDIKVRDIISINDLCDLYKVSIATIERDLNSLRNRGIPIHSQSKEGITINGSVNDKILRDEFLRYISICYADSFDELLNFNPYSKEKWDLLSLFIRLQRSIDNVQYIRIALKNSESSRIYVPRKIIRKRGNWYLIVEHNGCFEVLSLSEIKEINDTYLTEVKRYKYGIDEFIESYFKIESNDKIELTLSFASKINGEFPSQISRTEFLKYDSKGNKIVTAVCNNLDDIVPWLLTNAGKISVLEPPELKDKLINIAETVLQEYDKSKEEPLYSWDYIPEPVQVFNPVKFYEPEKENFSFNFLMEQK